MVRYYDPASVRVIMNGRASRFERLDRLGRVLRYPHETAHIPTARRQAIRLARREGARARFQCGAMSRRYARELFADHCRHVPERWRALSERVFVEEAVRRGRAGS